MKFLVDAQLPKWLSEFLNHRGFNSIHTLELPLKNATDDKEILRISMKEQSIVITKDRDFFQSYILQNMPWKLLLLSTGNITNKELSELFDNRLPQLEILFENHYVIEMDKKIVVVHY